MAAAPSHPPDPAAVASTSGGPTDADLVERMSRGDQRALGVIYDRYAADVARTIAVLLRGSPHAADLLQDVFLEAWKRADTFDPSRGSVRAWLRVRAKSRALDKLRSLARHEETELDEQEEAPAPSSSRRAAFLDLPEALAKLSPDERDVLVLGHSQGFTCAEMAAQLSIPVGTVKSRTRTAIEKLRLYWEGQPS